jgi:hypothetical protein
MLRSSTKMTVEIHLGPQTVNKKNIALLHVTHIIFMNGLIFFNLLHVTTWIWIEMESQLISIIDD